MQDRFFAKSDHIGILQPIFIMKATLSIFLLLFALSVNAQKIKLLTPVDPAHVVDSEKAIIYGSFMPRTQNWLKKGLQQYIRIKNIETNQVFSFEVVHYMSTSKQNIFEYLLDPGTYEIITYAWADEVVLGAKAHYEPVWKDFDITDSLNIKKIQSDEISSNDLKHYRFTVAANTLCYLGKWNFTTGLITFSDTKPETDQKIKKDFLTLDFDKAITILPQ